MMQERELTEQEKQDQRATYLKMQESLAWARHGIHDEPGTVKARTPEEIRISRKAARKAQRKARKKSRK